MRRYGATLVCVIAGALVAAPALAIPQPVAFGHGVGFFPANAGPFAGDLLRLTVHVKADGTGGAVAGTFRGEHLFAAGGTFARISGVIDCIRKTGPNAIVMTGVITQGFDSRGLDIDGERVSIGLVDGHPDTMGVDVAFVPFPHPIPPCTHRALLTVDVAYGDFMIR